MKLVFVSSTFKDMQFERDRLHSHVVPMIDSALSKYGESVYFGDLRWGVNTSGMDGLEGSKKVLDVCLDEIDGCKPYMIVLIGERYGWIPEDVLIKQAAVLKGIEVPSDISVTQLEIEYGALLNPDSEGRVLFYFRNLDKSGMSDEERRDYEGESSLHTQKIEELKKRILSLYPDQVRYYNAKWDSQSKSVVELDDLMAKIESDLLAIFLKDINRDLSIPWQERALASADKYYLERAKNYYPVTRTTFEFSGGIYSDEQPHMYVIKGGAGHGKTSFIANKYYQYTKHSQYADKKLLVPFVFELDSFSSNPDNFLKLMLYKIEDYLGEEHMPLLEDSPVTKEVFDRLQWLEKGIEGRGLAVFIDNATQAMMNKISNLYPWCDTFETILTPTEEIKNKYYIVLQDGEDDNPVCPLFDYSRSFFLRELFHSEIKPFIHTLIKGKHKELSEDVIDYVYTKHAACNPLYLSLVIDRLLMLDSADFARIRAMGDGMEAINAYMISIVKGLGSSIEDIIKELCDEAGDRIDRQFVLRFLGVLAYTEIFLSEQEIREVFEYYGWEYSQLNMALTIKTLSCFINNRASERLYSVKNALFAKAIRQFVKSHDEDFCKKITQYALSKRQSRLYSYAYKMSIYSRDADFMLSTFLSIFNDNLRDGGNTEIRRRLIDDTSYAVSSVVIGMNSSFVLSATPPKPKSDDEMLKVLTTFLLKLVIMNADTDFTFLITNFPAILFVSKNQVAMFSVFGALKKALDECKEHFSHRAVSAFYVYLCSIMARTGYKFASEYRYYATNVQNNLNLLGRINLDAMNYHTLLLTELEADDLKNEIGFDHQNVLASLKDDLNAWYYFGESVQNKPNADYINGIQYGHMAYSYHLVYRQCKDIEKSKKYLIEAVNFYDKIDLYSPIIERATYDDFATFTLATIDYIKYYCPEHKKREYFERISQYMRRSFEVLGNYHINLLMPEVIMANIDEGAYLPTEGDEYEWACLVFRRAFSYQAAISVTYPGQLNVNKGFKIFKNYLDINSGYDLFSRMDYELNKMYFLLVSYSSGAHEKYKAMTVAVTFLNLFFEYEAYFERVYNSNKPDVLDRLFTNLGAMDGNDIPPIAALALRYLKYKYYTPDEKQQKKDKKELIKFLKLIKSGKAKWEAKDVLANAEKKSSNYLIVYASIVKHIEEALLAKKRR